jgi:hypothetical protein
MVAYRCPPYVDGIGTTKLLESVVEATPQDGTAYSLNCFQPALPSMVSGNLQVDASSLPGTKTIGIFGKSGRGGGETLGGGFVSGPVPYSMLPGTYDIAVTASDGTANSLALKILRNQTPPGINGGNPVVFSPADVTTTQPVTVTNAPAGFNLGPAWLVNYESANGLFFGLGNNANLGSQYHVVPAALAQPGDFYRYDSFARDQNSDWVGMMQTTSQGGGAVSLALPAPWIYSGPAPATLPTFSLNYSGFPATVEYAKIEWPPTPHVTHTQVTVTATANFQNGATTITVPDLSSLSGFLAPAPSGTNVSWTAAVFGGTMPGIQVIPSQEGSNAALVPFVMSSNGSITFVQTQGTYTP